MGPEQSDFVIMLHPEREWTTGRTKEDLVAAMETELARVPGLRLSFSQPIALRVNELISGIKSDLAVKIAGPDLDVLEDRAQAVAAVLGAVRGAEDVKVEQVAGFMQAEVTIDRKAIARYRINVSDINDIIETAVGGRVATTVVEGQQRVAVLVRFPEEDRLDLGAIERLIVPAPGGEQVALGRLARVGMVEAPAQISRENGQRRIVVECNVRGRDMGSFVSEVRDRIRPVLAGLPPGYFVDYGGQFENQQRAMRRLAVVVPLSIGLIFLLLFMAFGALRSALLVLANLPFALVGGVLSIYLLGINLSVSAAIGFIAVFGIAVENGTVLVSFFNELSRKGMSRVDAVLKGCDLRFRALLMTAMTTLLGLTPMLYATGSGAEIQRPLAAVVMGGLISSMFLTLFVLPVLYAMAGGAGNSGSDSARRQRPQ